jgi:hypothetical protein
MTISDQQMDKSIFLDTDSNFFSFNAWNDDSEDLPRTDINRIDEVNAHEDET